MSQLSQDPENLGTYEGLSLYAVCLKSPDGPWIEFYWADDREHAEEQAEDANQDAEVACVAYAQRYVDDYGVELSKALALEREQS